MIGLQHFMVLASIIFCIGVFGILSAKKSLIMILLSIELMLLSANINIVATSSFIGDTNGHILTLSILSIAAAEIVIGLSILINYFKYKGLIDIDDNIILKDE